MADPSLGLGTYAAVFVPLQTFGRAEVITRRLTDAITLGVLPDGLPLPSEAELADRFGVATVTVREALRAESSFHLELAMAAHSARLAREELALQSWIGPMLWLAHSHAGARRRRGRLPRGGWSRL